MTVAGAISAAASAAAGAVSLVNLGKELEGLIAGGQLKATDPLPAPHATLMAEAYGKMVPPFPRRVAAVCGIDCHPGDFLCNNFCNQAPEKGKMPDYPPLFSPVMEMSGAEYTG